MKGLDRALKSIYYNHVHGASFGSVKKLWDAVKESGFPSARLKQVQSWLKKQDTYTLHAPVRKKFSRNRVIVRGIDENWEADLVDVQNLKQYNDGYRYILTCIDVLSKFAWVVPLKAKTAKDIINAFKRILEGGRCPLLLHTDKGSEFMNTKFQNFLKDQNIQFFTTENSEKCSILERFNRTIKTRLWHNFTFENSYRYIDILDKLLQGYNNSVHSSIRMKPIEVTIENQRQALDALYGPRNGLEPKRSKRFRYSVGDQVRISKNKLRFEKGYAANWSEEIFTISKRLHRVPPVYRLTDYNGEEIRGTFYEPELLSVIKPKHTKFLIEKVVTTRTRKGKKQYLIRWKGYGKEFDSWVNKLEKR